MSEWNAMTYEGKDTILRVVRHEAEQFFALADDPEAWERADRVRELVDARRGGPHRRHDRGLLPRVRRRPRRRRGPGAVRAAGHAREGQRVRHRVPRRAAGRADAAAARRLPQDAGAPRRARPGRLDRADGHPPLHGSGAGVLLRRRPADGLRRALVGHPRGQRPQPRALRRRRRPAGAVHVRDLAGHRARRRGGRAVHDRHPGQRAQRRRLPGVGQRRGAQPTSRARSRACRRTSSSTPAAWCCARSAGATTARCAATWRSRERFLNSFFRI